VWRGKPHERTEHGAEKRTFVTSWAAFSVIATIAFWAGIAAFVLAGIMAVLVAFGFWHARRTPEDGS
jgi:hypothetical protein